MLSAIKQATELKWDAPYRVATSLLALLLIGSGFQRPLLTGILAFSGGFVPPGLRRDRASLHEL